MPHRGKKKISRKATAATAAAAATGSPVPVTTEVPAKRTSKDIVKPSAQLKRSSTQAGQGVTVTPTQISEAAKNPEPKLSKYRRKKLARKNAEQSEAPVETEGAPQKSSNAVSRRLEETAAASLLKKQLERRKKAERKKLGKAERGQALDLSKVKAKGMGRRAIRKRKLEEKKKAEIQKADLTKPEAGAEKGLQKKKVQTPVQKMEDPEDEVLPAEIVARNSLPPRLRGARFRMLNEALYTDTGAQALKMFSDDPSLMREYHAGFREQVANKWPDNPLDKVIGWLKKQPKIVSIGDFGCGEARLATTLKPEGKNVSSFDLVALNDHVTPCNIAAVPLEDKSLDCAVFCLALMGTDWPSFLREAHRCLKKGGYLYVVEVQSRLAGSSQPKDFARAVEGLGFKCEEASAEAKTRDYFVEWRFTKVGGDKAAKANIDSKILGPCIYKRR